MTTNFDVGPARTLVAALPVMEVVCVSVAVRVCVPAVLKVTRKVPTPLVNGEAPSCVPCGSVLVKLTRPL